MKVLFQNRDPETQFGGDWVQLENTIKALSKLNIDVSFDKAFTPELTNFDIVHLFHINFGWTWLQYQNAKSQGKKIVLTCIFYDTDQLGVDKQKMAEMFNGSSAVICFSKREAEEISSFLEVDINKIEIIPNGIEEEFFNKSISKGRYVVSVGRREEFKGHMRVLEACKKLKLPVIVVGGGGDPAYVDKLKEFDYGGCLDFIPHKAMPTIYNKAQVYVCASTGERMSLTVLEAAASGCNIVDSIFNRGNLRDLGVRIVDPRDENDLMEAILSEWEKPKNYLNLPNKLKNNTWLDIAKKIKDIYERIK